MGDGSRRSLDEAFAVLDQSLIDALDLIERYWRTELPERNEANEHSFVDNNLVEQVRILFALARTIALPVRVFFVYLEQESSTGATGQHSDHSSSDRKM